MENNQGANISPEKYILTKIWTAPREVFQFINDNKYDKYTDKLFILSGIASALSNHNLGDSFSLLTIITICVVFGGLFGWISLYFYSFLISLTGGWLNGKSNTDSMIRIVAYSYLPIVFTIFCIVIQISIYGVEVFKTDGDLTADSLFFNILGLGSIFVELILSIWSIVLLVIGISVTQKFSVWKSILNMILPALIIIVPLIIIIGIIYLFSN
ncbi:MAG: YIP1 family protein [Prevotellaceae bacterium]|jgi:hypothetical protein|nr:YIP1 family protein [Prevotellaceae bacterium]